MSERNDDVLKLENQVNFSLYACARETIKLYKPFLDKLDLTYTQYITMLVLWEDRQATVKELGRRLYLDSGTLTPLLKKLEDKSLISRRRSTSDERNLIVTITPEGEALKAQAADASRQMNKRLMLTQEETAELHRLLSKMLAYVPD